LQNVAGMKIRSRGSTKRETAFFVALVCLACGCATVDNANYGVPVDAANRPQATVAPTPLMVSAGEASSYSTSYLGLVEVTFENRTPVWKQVDRVTLDFGSPAKNQSVTIASADDIDAWERAITIHGAIQATNAATGIEALGMRPVDRLGVSIGQHHPAAPATGAGGVPVAAGAEASTVPAPPSYPDQHLLTTPFRIPPGLFTKRWILLSTSDNPPGGCIDSMLLSYETSDHVTGRVLLPFKVAGTDWQATACYVSAPPSGNGNQWGRP
jgi:hypothetical protein